MQTQTLTILGSTGSVGRQSLEVLERHRHKFRLFALTGGNNIALLRQQCLRYRPEYAAMANEKSADVLRQQLQEAGAKIDVLAGRAGILQLAAATENDCVIAAIVGAAGLASTIAAAQVGCRILLANKEAIVMAGALLQDLIKRYKGELIPIDSEHNGLFQCLPAGCRTEGVERLILTASGGPLQDIPLSQMHKVTPEQACNHPVWTMGPKISVDSATMMNKGLELIEAYWLFGIAIDKIQILIHRQGLVHALVQYHDGSTIAQLSKPDMRIPITQALGFPERLSSGVKTLDLAAIGSLHFARPDAARNPCLKLAQQALQEGGTATVTLNAANEIAVAAFLQRRIAFPQIAAVIEEVLTHEPAQQGSAIEDIWQADARARQRASSEIQSHKSP